MLTSAFFITFFRWVYYFYKYFWGANPNAQIIHLVLFIIYLEMFIFSLWGLTPESTLIADFIFPRIVQFYFFYYINYKW